MFDPETTAFLESGSALIVGTTDAEGAPHAGRAWGLEVLAPGPPARLRLLLDSDDERTIEHAAAHGAIAVTATSVRTLRSTQLKGRVLAVEAASTEADDRAQRYLDSFFTDIIETDGTDPALLAAFAPIGFVPCVIEVDERFDQTPGPGAGGRVDGAEAGQDQR